ncbi:TON1 Recruiting Motif 11 [Hibiscus trionum]|uniref:TON1 Recruiting Motif 11 n=1 Tax=Hibiscus trionum TaxID=183268 RepID=A0A9W7HF74_HIBTR|nr:TON1 Recruiting Motif 11 [Hibiscus trionum]
MALISIPTDHIKLRKMISLEKKPKPLMLKDYLLRDDLSSCSSNGFKSFPRQHCCTTVRFLLEAELKKSKDNYSTTTKRRSRSKPGAATTTTTTTTISALQRASEAVLNAVKLLPFPSIKSTSPPLRRNSFTRSFSRKLFKRSFWRKADKENDGGGEIRRCKLFREFLEEKNQPSDQNTSTTVVVTTADTSATTMIASSSRVSSNTSSNTWSESEFTADVLQSWSGNSESSSENDTVEGETNLPQKEKVSNIVGEESINFTKEQDWANEEGKEQFSPVSVLDCPFDDEEEEEEDNNSHFEDGSPHVKGTKPKLMQKARRLEGLTQLEPVDLETRIAMTELEDDDGEIIELVKARIPWEINKFMEDGLVLDLYRETGLEDLKMVENWVNGKCEDMFVGWEMEEGRKAYLKEMERNGNWRKFNEEEEDVGTTVELEVLSSLLDELLTDLF